MREVADGVDLKSRVIGFLWQHVLLFSSLFVMTAGVALCALGIRQQCYFNDTLCDDRGRRSLDGSEANDR